MISSLEQLFSNLSGTQKFKKKLTFFLMRRKRKIRLDAREQCTLNQLQNQYMKLRTRKQSAFMTRFVHAQIQVNCYSGVDDSPLGERGTFEPPERVKE